jgi:plasmid maintenance system killer protein
MLLLDLASGDADRRAGEANAAPIDFISSVSRCSYNNTWSIRINLNWAWFFSMENSSLLHYHQRNVELFF